MPTTFKLACALAAVGVVVWAWRRVFAIKPPWKCKDCVWHVHEQNYCRSSEEMAYADDSCIDFLAADMCLCGNCVGFDPQDERCGEDLKEVCRTDSCCHWSSKAARVVARKHTKEDTNEDSNSDQMW